jgi:hypothetical protein
MNPNKFLKSPIPGENLTQDTRGYAWHRPPQFPEFDDAFEHFVDNVLVSDKKLAAAITVLQTGIPATVAVSSILLGMVANGKISPDMSLLIAGPVYKTLTKTMDAMGISYLTGFDTPEEMEAFTNQDKKAKPKKLTAAQEKELETMQEELKEQEGKIPEGGLMGAPITSGEDVPIEIPAEQTGRSLVEVPEEDKE